MCQERAAASKLLSLTMRQYVEKYLQDFPELLDLLAAETVTPAGEAAAALHTDETAITLSRHYYPSHVSMEEISTGLKCKKYLRGTLRCRGDDWQSCYVVIHTSEGEQRRSVTVQGEEPPNISI